MGGKGKQKKSLRALKSWSDSGGRRLRGGCEMGGEVRTSDCVLHTVLLL